MPQKPQRLRRGDKANFNTLLMAASHGDLALVSAVGAADQKPATLLAVMVEGNPFELFEDPTA